MSELNEMRGNLKTAEAVQKFMFGGNATLTLKSVESGTSFTYKVSQVYKKDAAGNVTDEPETGLFFVSVLTGSDNEEDFTYAGLIRGDRFFANRKPNAKISATAPSSRAFAWTFERIARNHMPTNVEIWHEGRCGRCGRKLTVISSIENGFGPDCIEKVSAFAVMANQLFNQISAPAPAPEAQAPKVEAPKATCTKCGQVHKNMQTLEGIEGQFCVRCATGIQSLANSQGWSLAETYSTLTSKAVAVKQFTSEEVAERKAEREARRKAARDQETLAEQAFIRNGYNEIPE